jgi:murein DD-endopeptidase MepM/ murein hydrolase activator NlpD
VRRSHAYDIFVFWPRYAPVTAGQLRKFLPTWLSYLARLSFLHLLSVVESRPELRAAGGARAMLDRLAAQDIELWQRRLARYRAARRWKYQLRYRKARAGRIPQLPLRYAAHGIALCVVMVVVLASGASAGAGVLRLGSVLPAPVAQYSDSGQVVQWVPSSGPAAADDTLEQPAVRRPQNTFERAFVTAHEVVEGETLGELATLYRVSVASLFWANDLDRGGVLAAGQELRIPRISGIPYVIQPEDTLASIAERFQVAPQLISSFGANGLNDDRPLPVGQEIFIPNGISPYPEEILSRYGGEQGVAAMKAVAAGVVREADTNLRQGPGRDYPRVGYLDAGYRLKLLARHGDWVEVESGASGVGWVRADLIGLSDEALEGLPETNDFPALLPTWNWPTRGEITSSFGWRRIPYRSFHDGVDIANAAGTRIYAARTGQVIEAGWCSGFGYCVKIDHGSGIMTIYGHMLRKPPVFAGDTVDAGDLIGYMGSSYDRRGGGYSTGVHLHFTVKINGKAVNPLKFLP